MSTKYRFTENNEEPHFITMTLGGMDRQLELKASEKISMTPDFKVHSGADFKAAIWKEQDGVYQYDANGNLIADLSEGFKIKWTPYGKVREVQKGDSTTIRFRYDGTGSRVEKSVMSSTDTLITRYVRDASGNVMAIYSDSVLSEQPIYGSSRLGMYRGGDSTGMQILGHKNYELSNHLGNVLAVVTDNIYMNQDSTRARVVSTNDYYPFGLGMDGRSWNDSTYRYGFNGMEKDDEIKGNGNSYNFTFRVYDPRIGRFLSVDPIGKNYPHSSPYAFAENSPIQAIDLEGLEKYKVTGRSFIPMKTLDNPWYTPNFSASSFAGDDRMSYQLNTTAYRTEQVVNVDFDNKSVGYSNNTASGTKALDKTGKVIETSKAGPAGPVPTFDKSFLENGNAVTIHLSIDAPNKLVAGAPAINYQFDVTITQVLIGNRLNTKLQEIRMVFQLMSFG